jgi:hypothetical protein
MVGGELIRNVMTRLSIRDDFWLWDAVFVTRVPITECIRFLSFHLVTVRQKVKVSEHVGTARRNVTFSSP